MSARTLELTFRPTVGAMVTAAAEGKAREICCLGTRGDGKTVGALGAMVAHALRHHEAGYLLPTKWLGVADTFASHVAKTHESLLAPLWQGAWSLKGDGHVALFRVDGQDLVSLRLFGIEDQSGMDRLRAECHGLWFEEPAPASVLVQSSGLGETAWQLGLTSQRLPSHAHPALMSLNYPDEDHWTWQRFHEQPCPVHCDRTIVRDREGRELHGGCPHRYFYRIPPGELASAEQREEWEQALVNRPDMLRRLLQGQPGSLMLGQQVAAGFNRDLHVRSTGAPDPSYPLVLGQDGGESHSWATVIGQRANGRVKVYAALLSEPSGCRQHFEQEVIPWLGEYAPWALKRRDSIRVIYDPACDTEDPGDAESNPLRTMQSLLPGRYEPGPVSWPGRLNPMYALLNDNVGGRPVLEVDPTAKGLVRALDGGWYLATGPDGKLRKDTPKKPNHPHEDYGDAFCYFVCGVHPFARRDREPRQPSKIDFSPFRLERRPERNPSKVDFAVFR